MMEKRKRRQFTAEHKAEAVKRRAEGGKTLQEVAEELGVHTNQLRGWRNEQLAAGSAEASARPTAEAAELARLRREVKRLEPENAILRRAAAFMGWPAPPSGVAMGSPADRAYLNGVELDFLRPGKPTDNAHIEAFNARFRQECLNASWFLSLADAKGRIEAWRRDDDEKRPHSALRSLTPRAFATQAHPARRVA